MIRIPERIIDEAKDYRSKVEAFKNGKTDPVRFKPYRVGLGIYEQRELDTYMVRTRIPSGIMTFKQLKKISELADLYGHGHIHFTTRQDIQFHKISLNDTVNIVEELLDVGIITRGTGGNTARNVVCSSLSGVDVNEVFDVSDYAEETTSYLLKDPSVLNLPRKYKIVFSNSSEDTGNAYFADLGFIAKIQDGKKGFEVLGAGGLGSSPTSATKLEDFIPAEEVLYHVQAMKEIFENEGDRSNKHKARIRYILYRLGEEAFLNLYKKQVDKVKKEKDLDLQIKAKEEIVNEGNTAKMTSNLLTEQKQKGLYSVYVHPENGNLAIKDLNKIIQLIDTLNYEVSIRLTNTQGFYIRDLKGADADELLQIIEPFVSHYDIDNSIACAGAATCKLGLCLSQNLLSAIKERFINVQDDIKSALPKVFISGCPNSCGQHQNGEIGFSGKAKRVGDGLIPMYTVYLGVNKKDFKLAEAVGDVIAKKIPEFLYELASLKVNSGVEEFTAFLTNEKENIEKLINKFNNIEETDKDLYYDFGSDEPFSLKGRGPGECSAGVLDVIQLDISNAQTYFEEYNKTKSSKSLYQSALSASRALIILKGIDTDKDRIIFSEFIKHFVDTGYVNKKIKPIIDNLIDFKLGDIDSIDAYASDIEYLVNKVNAMYKSLSPQLEVTLEKEEEVEQEDIQSEVNTNNDLKIVDLKGVKCPINFVKVKVELSAINSGEVLGFYLDDGEPIKNVPRSVESEGHTIIDIDTNYDGYNLITVKKA